MWNRVPVLVRAFMATIAVTGIAEVVWEALIQINLRFAPRVPWAAILMSAFLLFYWKYLKGWGWPESTAAKRRASLRAEPLSALVWRWSLREAGISRLRGAVRCLA